LDISKSNISNSSIKLLLNGAPNLIHLFASEIAEITNIQINLPKLQYLYMQNNLSLSELDVVGEALLTVNVLGNYCLRTISVKSPSRVYLNANDCLELRNLQLSCPEMEDMSLTNSKLSTKTLISVISTLPKLGTLDITSCKKASGVKISRAIDRDSLTITHDESKPRYKKDDVSPRNARKFSRSPSPDSD